MLRLPALLCAVFAHFSVFAHAQQQQQQQSLITKNGPVVPVPPATQSRCYAREPADGSTLYYRFSQWANPPATRVLSAKRPNGGTWPMTAQLQFCDRLDLVQGDVAKEGTQPEEWTGWSFGRMQTLERVFGTSKAKTGPGADAEPDFRMEMVGGDAGFPCVEGRSATVDIFCSSGAPSGLSRHSCPVAEPRGLASSPPSSSSSLRADTPGQCPPNISQSYCACETAYSFVDDSGCKLRMSVLAACPKPTSDHTVLPPDLSPTPKEATAGEVIGYIILALVIFSLVLCAGGTLYNMKVKNLQGVDAIPFVHVLRPSVTAEYSAAPQDQDPSEGSAAGEGGGYGTL